MKIIKFGHCCLMIETDGKRLLTDPGVWNELPQDLEHIDIVLITHEHSDHLHIEHLKEILKTNPEVKIITNKAVGAILDKEGIKYELMAGGESGEILGVKLSGHGNFHAALPEITAVENTSFMIAEKLYHPGDAFVNPNLKVDILALPVCGPWLDMHSVISFAKELKPRIAFPIHDGMLKITGPFHALPGMLLPKAGIEFKPLLAGDSILV